MPSSNDDRRSWRRAADERLGITSRLSFSPIVGVHLWFDRRVLELPFAALVGAPLHWVFDRGVGPDGGQRLHGVTSAAREWADLPREEVVRRVIKELHRYVPASAGARLTRAEVFKERRATFSPAPPKLCAPKLSRSTPASAALRYQVAACSKSCVISSPFRYA